MEPSGSVKEEELLHTFLHTHFNRICLVWVLTYAPFKVVKVGNEDWPNSQQISEVGATHVLRWKVEWRDRTVMVPLERASLCPWTLS
jgi:hypothetical protein